MLKTFVNYYSYWLRTLCNQVYPNNSYYVYHVECDFKSCGRKNLPFLIKWKYKKLLKKENKTIEEFLECCQIATKFYLKSDIDALPEVIYDSTTDLFY